MALLRMHVFEGCVHCGMMCLIIRVGHYVGFWHVELMSGVSPTKILLHRYQICH